MGQEQTDKGHEIDIRHLPVKNKGYHDVDFVLEKSIFANIFEKDIRRVFIYKKAERLAKAIHLITPAFAESPSLRNRIDAIAIGLIDSAILPSGATRTALSRELLALSSILSIARTGGFLSQMNTELITHEAHILLQEVATYEEPRLSLDDAPTLSSIARNAQSAPAKGIVHTSYQARGGPLPAGRQAQGGKGQNKAVSDIRVKDRREGIMSVIRNKGTASIKDISMMIRGVSEKTIQRELQSLVEARLISKQGERRWSRYSII